MDKLDNDIISIIQKYLKCRTYLCKNYGIKLLYRYISHNGQFYFFCSNCYRIILFGY